MAVADNTDILKQAEDYFLHYKFDEAIPLLKELVRKNNNRARYMLSIIYTWDDATEINYHPIYAKKIIFQGLKQKDILCTIKYFRENLSMLRYLRTLYGENKELEIIRKRKEIFERLNLHKKILELESAEDHFLQYEIGRYYGTIANEMLDCYIEADENSLFYLGLHKDEIDFENILEYFKDYESQCKLEEFCKTKARIYRLKADNLLSLSKDHVGVISEDEKLYDGGKLRKINAKKLVKEGSYKTAFLLGEEYFGYRDSWIDYDWDFDQRQRKCKVNLSLKYYKIALKAIGDKFKKSYGYNQINGRLALLSLMVGDVEAAEKYIENCQFVTEKAIYNTLCGIMYYYGDNVAMDYKKAYEHFCTVIKYTDSPIAQYFLALLCLNENFVQHDYQKGKALMTGVISYWADQGINDWEPNYYNFLCVNEFPHWPIIGKDMADKIKETIGFKGKFMDRTFGDLIAGLLESGCLK